MERAAVLCLKRHERLAFGVAAALTGLSRTHFRYIHDALRCAIAISTQTWGHISHLPQAHPKPGCPVRLQLPTIFLGRLESKTPPRRSLCSCSPAVLIQQTKKNRITTRVHKSVYNVLRFEKGPVMYDIRGHGSICAIFVTLPPI